MQACIMRPSLRLFSRIRRTRPRTSGNCCGIICISYRPASALERAQANGLIIRAVQDSIAFCPPLIITEEQVHDLVDRFVKSLDQVSI